MKKSLIAMLASLVLGHAQGTAYTITYDGVTYNNVGVQQVSNLTYSQFYSIASVQPWFIGAGSCYVSYLDPLNSCDELNAKFTSAPAFGTGTAVTRAVLPSDYVEEVSNIELFATDIGLANTFYVGPDDFGGMFYLLMNAISPTDTKASLEPNALALRNAFTLQSTKIVQGLTYDCLVYDQKNLCVSFAGSKSDGKGFDSTIGALILAHKLTSNFRFGGYIDQSTGSSTSGGLTLKKGSPGLGAFGVWSQNADGSGLEVRASANVGKLDMETTRTPIESAEAGFGKSNIKSSGFQLEVSRDYAINNAWSARPYLGYRKTTNKRAGYTEVESDDVAAPLTYSTLKQNTETALAGVRFGHQITQKTALTLSAGLEQDLKNNVDRYQALNADIGDIDSIDMASTKRKTRPVMAFSLNHNLDKNQRIGVSVTHRKEAFESGSSTSAMVQYSVGF